MDVERIVKELRRERERLDRAIMALEESDGMGTTVRTRGAATSAMSTGQNGKGPGRHLTPAGRRRLSEAMKKRWAERRKKMA